MKKFIWPLQRLLDVKEKQEDFAKLELVAITERIVMIRGQIMMQKSILRSLFSELNQLAPPQRPLRQAECMEYARVTNAKIKTLNQDLEKTEQQRAKKTDEIVKLRKLRKSLEQLRAKALTRYRKDINHAEQKELDESITTIFARKILMPT